MREIKTHKDAEDLCNSSIRVTAEDEAGYGQTNHSYLIRLVDTNNPNDPTKDLMEPINVNFQNGPLREKEVGIIGINGITHESLLAILIDRLRSFQSSAYCCRENGLALTKLEEALHWLNQRTKNRRDRGVEGTHII